ncbi:hypothetical protein DNK48_13195 [Streptomyces malaysiensis subsp. malaysiensis]|uniref:hypothetical protein n=2 Tax=Streptomyces malaysiensis TaxID=92644 RepID=UPI000BFE0E04|nr:hypothetical protein [Streptomyces malaysiensis]ATL86177.1 hypothetical protein SMALA_5949 [Streptomyces malaysiensis]QDL70209.1 hypothetical protein DNK48_13195 [Streptomyces malaysiensis]
MMAPEQTSEEAKGSFTDQAWRMAIGHAAGCLVCRMSGVECETGGQLLGAYEEAIREARAEEIA